MAAMSKRDDVNHLLHKGVILVDATILSLLLAMLLVVLEVLWPCLQLLQANGLRTSMVSISYPIACKEYRKVDGAGCMLHAIDESKR